MIRHGESEREKRIKKRFAKCYQIFTYIISSLLTSKAHFVCEVRKMGSWRGMGWGW